MANVHDLITAEIAKLKAELEVKLSDFNPEKLSAFLDTLEDNLKSHVDSVLTAFKLQIETLVDEKIAALKPETAGIGAAGDYEATLVNNQTSDIQEHN